jgi:hypothetical protein
VIEGMEARKRKKPGMGRSKEIMVDKKIEVGLANGGKMVVSEYGWGKEVQTFNATGEILIWSRESDEIIDTYYYNSKLRRPGYAYKMQRLNKSTGRMTTTRLG